MNKEKLRGIILGATISAAVFVPTSNAYASEVHSKGTVQNVSSSLRVRESASTNSAVVGSLKNDEIVDVKGKTGDWYSIQCGSVTGYVYDEYIKVSVDAEKASRASVNSTAYVTNVSTSLRLRKEPSTSSNVIDFLKNGQALKIEGEENNWYKVSVNGKTGYVSKDYVKVSSSSSINSSSNSTSNSTNNSTSTGTSQSYEAKNATLHDVSSSLRIRSAASTSGSVLGYIHPGTTFKVIGESGSWYHVDVNGQKGYASKEYIKISATGSTNNSTGSTSNNTTNNTTPSSPSTGTSNSYEVKNGTLQNVSSSLRIRSAASSSGSVVGYIHPGTVFKVIGESGSWYHVDVNGQKGYASKEYIKISAAGSTNDSTGSTSNNTTNNTTPSSPSTDTSNSYEAKNATLHDVSSSLRIRSEANSTGSVVGYIHPGTVFKVIGESGSWYHVDVNGQKGYASKEYIKFVTQSNTSDTTNNNTNNNVNNNVNNNTNNNNNNNNNNVGSGSTSQISVTYQKVLNLMEQQIGSPYVYGGSGEMLTTSLIDRLKVQFPSYASEGKYDNAAKEVGKGYRAFDCSGLMNWAFGQAGVRLGRTTYDQINNGVEVSLNNLQPGDLLFYSNLGHVGMYIGNGQWIESPNYNACVRITNVPWNSISRARRVL